MSRRPEAVPRSILLNMRKITSMNKVQISAVVLGALFAALAGCGNTRPPVRLNGYSYTVGARAAEVSLTMLGRPYRYGGNGPAGFDCSGLVQYSYASAGMKKVPHSTKELRRHTRSVPKRSMREGDILFFKQRGKSYSHVGIYVGDSRFVHAPSTGKTVRTDSVEDAYWRRHFLDARRFL